MQHWEVAFWVAIFLIWGLVTIVGLVREAHAVPLLGAHHGLGVGTGAPVPDRLTVASAIADPALPGDPGALNVELVGHIVLTAQPGHAGYTLAEGRVQMIAPSRSTDIRVAANTLLVVASNWALPAAATWNQDASSLVQVRGSLVAPFGLTVDVPGPIPPVMPAVLIDADAITGPVTPGTVPAGTVLVTTPSQIRLEYAP